MQHRFVEYIPDSLDDDVLYVSLPFRTAVHRCACGCREEVVTPLGPAEWRLTYDGETISLAPSVGNWNFACRSHYVIRNGRIRWARSRSPDEVSEARAKTRERRLRYFARRCDGDDGNPGAPARRESPPPAPGQLPPRPGRPGQDDFPCLPRP